MRPPFFELAALLVTLMRDSDIDFPLAIKSPQLFFSTIVGEIGKPLENPALLSNETFFSRLFLLSTYVGLARLSLLISRTRAAQYQGELRN